MTPEQIKLVQESFKLVPAEAAAELFYGRLFEVAPAVRPMFTTDIKIQGKKLMAMLGVAVKGLSNIDAILPAVRELGARHAQYGARPEHYAVVGEVLNWTLRNGLGPAFTPAVEAAWDQAYDTLAAAMIDAAEAKQAA